jgi:hypothetical protein
MYTLSMNEITEFDSAHCGVSDVPFVHDPDRE